MQVKVYLVQRRSPEGAGQPVMETVEAYLTREAADAHSSRLPGTYVQKMVAHKGGPIPQKPSRS